MKKIREQKNIKNQLFATGCILFFSCSFLSFDNQTKDTSSSEQQEELISSKNEISDWEARLELARVLSYSKKYDESLQEYKQLLQAKPDFFKARIEMAKVLFYQEKIDEALIELSKVPHQEIDDASWVIIADIYRKKKNYQAAEDIYFQYLKKFPQDDKIRLKLAEIFSWEKRYLESIHQYRIILSHQPDDLQVRRRYAQVLTWMGEDQEAIKEWRKTLK